MSWHNMVLGSLSAGRWTPGIGDPTLLGWLTVVAYLIGAALCWRRAVIIRGVRWPSYGRGEPLFWLVCTVFLLALGINKQLDLQTWFTVFGKELAKDMGWYAERRIVQGAFVALLGIAGLVLTAVGMWWTKQLSVASRVAFAGAVFLGIFIMVRAASFHHVDQMLGVRLAGLRLNVLLEMGGIACMGVAAAGTLKHSQKDIAKAASRPQVIAF
jgi:hypothetical protein